MLNLRAQKSIGTISQATHSVEKEGHKSGAEATSVYKFKLLQLQHAQLHVAILLHDKVAGQNHATKLQA